MAERRYSFLIYSNGCVQHGQDGIYYDGPPPTLIRVNRGIVFAELESKILAAMGLHREDAKIKVTYRLPHQSYPQPVKYTALPITNDDCVEAIFDVLQLIPGFVTAELYVDVESTPICQNGIANEGPSTQCSPISSPVNTPTPYSQNDYIAPMNTSSALLLDDNDSPSTHPQDDNDAHSLHPQDDNVIPEPVGVENVDNEEMATVTIDVIQDMAGKIQQMEEQGVVNDDELLEEDGYDEELFDYEHNCHDGQRQAIHQAPSPLFTQNTWKNIVDQSSQAITIKQTTWEPTQEFYKGLIFADKEKLKSAVKRYCILRNKMYLVKESGPTRWSLSCKNGCNWRLRACKRVTHGFFKVTKYCGPHTCMESNPTEDHAMLDSWLIEQEVNVLVKEKPSVKISLLQAQIWKKYGQHVSYMKVWEAKQKILAKVFGDWEKSYQILPKWMTAMVDANPGTKVKWCTHDAAVAGSAIFQRLFWAFGPSIEGFKHCRPIISIDATFLYGKYKGKLMIASTWDGDNQLFPLAFAIVEEESDDSWGWFLACIKEHVTQRSGVCLISDQHNGILSAVAEFGWQPPHGYHRFCIRHLATNFNERFQCTQLKDWITCAGQENQPRKFEIAMSAIRDMHSEAANKLAEIPMEMWTLAHDGGCRYGAMTTNLSESFNGLLKDARHLPITSLVQLTFYRTVYYFQDRRTKVQAEIAAGETFTAYVRTKFTNWEQKSRDHAFRVYNREEGVFDIHKSADPDFADRDSHVHVVNLVQKTCTCQKWQIYKIPCSHVIAVCQSQHLQPDQYIDRCYTMEEQLACYASKFKPVLDATYWKEPDFPKLYPNSTIRRERGRPKVSQLGDEMDWRESQPKPTCGLCRQVGHNRRKCPNSNVTSSSSGSTNQ